jgi:hypothetical protein
MTALLVTAANHTSSALHKVLQALLNKSSSVATHLRLSLIQQTLINRIARASRLCTLGPSYLCGLTEHSISFIDLDARSPAFELHTVQPIGARSARRRRRHGRRCTRPQAPCSAQPQLARHTKRLLTLRAQQQQQHYQQQKAGQLLQDTS